MQRFEQVDVPGPFQRRGEGCTHAALEAHAVTLQPHTAAEELDDLRALAAPNVHQSHGAHTPAAPALGELLRTNEHVDGGVRLVQLVEQRSGKFPLGNMQAAGFAQLRQLGVSTDVDDAKERVVAHAHADFAGGALQVLDVQQAACGSVEQDRKCFVEDLFG